MLILEIIFYQLNKDPYSLGSEFEQKFREKLKKIKGKLIKKKMASFGFKSIKEPKIQREKRKIESVSGETQVSFKKQKKESPTVFPTPVQQPEALTYRPEASTLVKPTHSLSK